MDELAQTNSYFKPLNRVATTAIRHAQGPLDYIANSILQRLLGVGDLKQRLLSIFSGCAAVLTMCMLGVRLGLGRYVVVSALVLAFSPVWVRYTAYARPYALPTFLMLLYLWTADLWLDKKLARYAVIVGLTAIALALSRSVEPAIFLSVVIAATGFQLYRRTSRFGLRHWAVLASVNVAVLCCISLPIFYLSSQSFRVHLTSETSANFGNLTRMFVDLPSVFGNSLPAWPIAVGIVAISLVHRRTRERVIHCWQWWVLLLVPAASAFLFFLLAQYDQTYAERYTFFWYPWFALTIGILFHEVVSGGERPMIHKNVIAYTMLGVLLVSNVARALENIERHGRASYRKASEYIQATLTPGTRILYDYVADVRSWRPRFYGTPRYLPEAFKVLSPTSVMRDPDVIQEGTPLAVLLSRRRPAVRGWHQIRIDAGFTLYLSANPRVGKHGAIRAYEEFSARVPENESVVMRMGLAALRVALGEKAKAKQVARDYCGKLTKAERKRLNDVVNHFVGKKTVREVLACR